MKFHGAVGGLLFSVLAGSLALAGCSTSTTGGTGSGTGPGGTGEPPITGCSTDDSLNCSGGGYGYSCQSGDNPENYDSLVCSDPTPNSDGTDGFCCVVDNSIPSGCTADDSISASCAEGYGFSCAAGDNPESSDPSLLCSDPTADGSNDDFCCTYTGSGSSSGGGTTGCASDSSLACDAGSTGVSCSGDTPDPATYGICSDPSPQSDGSDGYCCVDETFTDCVQDDSVTASCDYPSFGFSCSSGSADPSTDDPSLTCSDPTTDPSTGNDLYCCQ